MSGAGGRTRTDDLLITNQLLYQLSYAGRRVGVPSTFAPPRSAALRRDGQNPQSSTTAAGAQTAAAVFPRQTAHGDKRLLPFAG